MKSTTPFVKGQNSTYYPKPVFCCLLILMKRITISLDDEIYASLIDYAAEACKEDLSRLSLSRAMRLLLANELQRLNYYPMSEKRKQELNNRRIVRERAQQHIMETDPFTFMQEKMIIK